MRHVEVSAHCYHGINGRIVVAEVITPDAPFLNCTGQKVNRSRKPTGIVKWVVLRVISTFFTTSM
ncbi:hypothetical protein [Candidatus Williamhamiltonella defendens]|uniref:hypothetical protein n=1 Tax=Candidatus Williamhamiltonella defendens TaxID=138072 RepID=UPI00130D75DE|nr:hypothetical protein [Candidatus Hamiltonella defensa]